MPVYLFTHILFMSLSASAVIAVLLLLCRFGNKQLTNRWKYYIWLLPMLLLILPFSFRFPITLPDTAATPDTVSQTAIQADSPAPSPVAEHTAAGAALGTESQNAEPLPPQTDEGLPRSAPYSGQSAAAGTRLLIELGAYVWIAGMLVFLLREIAGTVRFARIRRRIALPCRAEDEKIFRGLLTELNILKPVTLKSFAGSGSPFLCGIFFPAVYLPREGLEESETVPALKHELTHCKRADLLYKQVMRWFCILHWFNPLVWLMARRAELYRELSCDEAVARKMNLADRKAYSLTILKLMKQNTPVYPSSAYLAEKKIKNKQNVKDRLEAIMKDSKFSILKRSVSLALAGVLCFSSAVFAAELNSLNPNSLSGNLYTTDRFSYLSYIDEENPEESLSFRIDYGSEISGSAALVNTPSLKQFRARITAANFAPESMEPEVWDESSPTPSPEPKNAVFEIRMTALESVLQTQNTWTGRFTVIKDGVTVMENAYGELQNPPGTNADNLTALYIWENPRTDTRDQGETKILRLSRMDFGALDTYDIPNTRAAKFQMLKTLYEAEGTVQAKLAYDPGNTLFGETIVPRETEAYVSYNPALKQADAHILIQTGDELYPRNYQIALQPQFVTACTEDTVSGLFSLELPYQTYREFQGTLRGLSGSAGSAVTLQADDGSVDLAFTLESSGLLTRLTPEDTYLPPDLAITHTYPFQQIRVDELPFAVTLTEDAVTIRYTGDPNLHWGAVLATYGTTPETDTWQTVLGENTENQTFTFPLLTDYASGQYLCFDVYSAETGTTYYMYDTSISNYGPQPIFTNCQVFERVNETGGIPEEFRSRYQLEESGN